MAKRAFWRPLPTDPRTKLGWMRKTAFDYLSPPNLAATLPAPSSLPHFNFRAEVGRGGFVRGVDYGMLSFVDGWLHFEGRRTAFALSVADVRRVGEQGLLTSFTLSDGSFVNLIPLGKSFDQRADVYDLLCRWHTEPQRAVGESVLPPADALPNVFAAASLMTVAGLLVAGLGAGAGFFLQTNVPLVLLVPGGLAAAWGLIEAAQLRANGAS